MRARLVALLVALLLVAGLAGAAPASASTYTSRLVGCTTYDGSNQVTYYHWLRVYGYQGNGWFSIRSAAIRTHSGSGLDVIDSVRYSGKQVRSSDGAVVDYYGPTTKPWNQGVDHYYEYDLVDGSNLMRVYMEFKINIPLWPDDTCTTGVINSGDPNGNWEL